MGFDVVGVKYQADLSELTAANKQAVDNNIALDKSVKSVGKAYDTMADTATKDLADIDARTKQLKEANLKNADVVKMLIDREKQLTESRAKATDPAKIAAYNKQLAETAAIIDNEFKVAAETVTATSAAIGKGSKDLSGFKTSVQGYAVAFSSAFDTLQQELAKVRNDLKDPGLKGAALDELIKKEALLTQVSEGLNREFSSIRGQTKAFQEAAKQIGIAMGQNTDTFQKFRAEVGKSVDDLNDIQDSIKLAASDTGALDALIGAANGVAGGFAVAEGATALFTDESEQLQKTMVKLQAVMSIVNGLQAVQAELKNKDSVATKALMVVQRLYAFAVGTSTGAMKAFKIALISTGIGAIIVALGFLIANFDAIVQAVKNFIGVSDEAAQSVEQMDEAIERNNEASKAFVKNRELAISLMKDEKKQAEALAKFRRDQAIKEASLIENDSARKRQLALIEEVYQNDLIKISEDADKKREDKRKKDADESKKLADQRAKMEQDYQVLLLENMEEGEEKLIASENAKYAKRKSELQGNYKALEQLEIQHQNELKKIVDTANQDELQKELDEQHDTQTKLKKAEEDFNKSKQDDLMSALEEVEVSQEGAREEKLKKDEEDVERTRQVEQAKSDIINSVVDTSFQILEQRRQAKFDKEISDLQKQREAELQVEGLTEEQKLAITEKFTAQENEIKKKQFQKNKATALIEATIATALSVTKLLATPPLAIAAGVLGLAQIAIIASQPEPQFKDGVIDLQGPGTGTSDSIRARLSRGESVMKATETKEYKSELMAIRKGNFEDFIFQTRVLPIVKNALEQRDMAANMNNSFNLQNMFDDTGIVRAIRKQQPATAKDIQELGNRISRSMQDAAYINSKKWKA